MSMYAARHSISVRTALTFCSILTCLALAWGVSLTGYHAAHASSVSLQTTALPSPLPWGVAFDAGGHVWVAETGCDPQPICGSNGSGSIAEYTGQSFSLVQNFSVPSNFSNPLFLAVDSGGDVWFTEPATNSIGELTVVAGTPHWQQWTVPTANAGPYDLAFDTSGNLWFTEFTASNIGEFRPGTQQFSETPTPTSHSNPYGITGPDPVTGSLWFTENSSSVSQIGRFTPPGGSASLSTNAIMEYPTITRINSTPHLIAFDTSGNIWWTEGFAGKIGRLVIGLATNGTSNGMTEFPVPLACSSCSIHLSGIAADSTGTIWFSDSLGSRLVSFAPATSVFTSYAVQDGSHPHDGLAIDSNNTIWFTEEFGDMLGEAVQSGLPTPTPTPSSSGGTPVSNIWYFAEGRVSSTFTQFFSIENPDTSNACSVNIRYLYTVDGQSPASKTVTLSIPPRTRKTESANNDLNIPANHAASDSTIISVNSSVTPACSGIVAERPMYFTYGSVKSGSDALGATNLNTQFYFADVPTGGGYASFVTILNPGSSTAHITATYYASGTVAGSQSLAVAPGTRGTLVPGAAHLPLHVAASVSSDQPVVIERPTYFASINGGNAGIVSGAACVQGASNLANDWLFAEGYTGGRFQEYLVISNVDTAASSTASVTIRLKYPDGSNQTFTLALASLSQVIWNVNQHGKVGSLSAEVTSSGARIVVERQMFFQYRLSNANALSIGGTDVIGLAGSGSAAYSFSEGYVRAGYNEYLTIQNPTSSTEIIRLTAVNGYGRNTTQTFQVGANSRLTINITALALQYLVHAGDGSPGYEISLVASSQNNAPFIAERVMYWNTAGSSSPTQGGADVIGYHV